jgi:predicted N-acetyltransferase YhbS
MTPVPAVLGWPPGPRLRLDYRAFAYAGKFVMSSTGKAVLLDVGDPPSEKRGEKDGTNGMDTVADALLDEADRERLAHAAKEEGWSPDAAILAAVAFSEDRTDPEVLCVRYVTVRNDRQGEGLGPQLLRFLCDRADERGYDRVRIGVNNAFSYEAAYRAGFGWTGEETGLAELVCEWPAPDGRSAERYRAGLDRFRAPEREPSESERSFLDSRGGTPPARVGTVGTFHN